MAPSARYRNGSAPVPRLAQRRALPCYASGMEQPVPVPTPESLAERLRAAPGSKDRFGATAAVVLETAALVSAAAGAWDKGTIAAFQDQQGIHAKVWGKLVSIAKSSNLSSLPKDDLPASYTALYALEVMSPQELQAAVADGLLKSKPLSSRAILDWTKAYRLKDTGIEREMPLTLVFREDLSEEQQQDLLEALGRVAKEFGAEVREGKGGVRQAEVKAEVRQARSAELEDLLLREIGEVVVAAPETLKTQFQVHSAIDLVTGPREQFTGFLQVLGNRVKEAFWRDYGRAYCLKIAHDFNVTDSRAERYQLKKRLVDAKAKWASEIKGFGEIVDDVMRTYMDK